MSDDHKFDYFYRHRNLCDVLREMRQCVKTLNFSPLQSLIEEAQMLGNRMEAALENQKDLQKLDTETALARRSYKNLQREYEALKAKLATLKPENKDESQEEKLQKTKNKKEDLQLPESSPLADIVDAIVGIGAGLFADAKSAPREMRESVAANLKQTAKKVGKKGVKPRKTNL